MSAAAEILGALGYALFEREENGALLLQGEAPEWLSALWDSLGKNGATLPVEQASPFFENFLIDAVEAWEGGGETRAVSGPWIETKPDGSEITLEATALTAGDAPMLLLARQGQEFEAKKAVLQTARETVIAYQRLNSETQKKEVLLSWIAEQMNTALANVITSLRLIELETNPPRTSQLLGLAVRAADEQQGLINRILTLFKRELEGLYGRTEKAEQGASFGEILPAVQEELAPQFAEKRVKLVASAEGANGSRIAMDATHLRRVVSSLLLTALAAARREVSCELRADADALTLRVCDDGAPLPPDICDGLLSKTSAAASDPESPALRLQFCRIAVENCGGEIGYEAREPSGNCIWLRLPKAAAPSR
ncbi:MAG: HAMP domain-containing histidine kinase [Verrucomicrobiota bacterium]|nr:HAMP domain-containing histidine kinase [Verrucomicrobiota bacterium]